MAHWNHVRPSRMTQWLMPWPVGFVLLLVSILSAIGCKRSETPEESAKKTVGVTLLTVPHQFYQDLRDGLEDEAKKHGYRLLISTAEFDPSRQANQIDEFLVQKVDALVVCPCDSRSVGASIAVANEARAPVFTADIAGAAAIGRVTTHIASNNIQGRREVAKLLARAIGGAGNLAILSHPEVASVTDRVNGFKKVIAGYDKIEVVAELSAEGKRDRAVRVMEDLLQAHDDIVGVFGINDDSALGALAAIEAAGKLGVIQVVGYDATPEARSRIQAGAIYGDVIQYPRKIGQLTMQTIHDYFEGRPTPASIPVDVDTYTSETP